MEIPMLSVYLYSNCSTCQKAKKYLKENGVSFTEIAIRETPPSKNELKRMLDYMDGNLHKLFNTSGMDYRSQNLKEVLPTLSTSEAIDMLHSNGNLVKRPFVIGEDFGTVGFNVETWDALFV